MIRPHVAVVGYGVRDPMSHSYQIKETRLTLDQIKRGFQLMLDRSLALKANGELLLVIFDETFRPYVEGFSQVIVERDINADLKFIPLHYQQHLTSKLRKGGLPQHLKMSLEHPNAVLCFLSGWKEGQPLRRDIVGYLRGNTNCRLAHVPGLCDEILEVVAETDFDAVVEDCELIAWVLGNGERAELETFDGLGGTYRLTLELGGWSNEPLMSPGIIEQGSWGNFPPAETFCCPRRDLVNGEVCINGSIPDMVLGEREEIVLRFESGRLVEWRSPHPGGGERTASFFEGERRKAESTRDTNWNSFCELGIGLNRAIKHLTGNGLFDEKIAKTIHVAIGGNQVFGHPIKSDVHFDMISKTPTLRIDDVTVIENGEMRVDDLKRRRSLWKPGEAEITDEMMIRINRSEVTDKDGVLFRRLQSGGRVGNVAMAGPEVSRQLALLAKQIEEPQRFGDLLAEATPSGALSVRDLVSYLLHYRTLLMS